MANKLRRSRDNRWIAGVCGGIAEYFGLSPKIVRIICALLIMVYGSGLMLYIRFVDIFEYHPVLPIILQALFILVRLGVSPPGLP